MRKLIITAMLFATVTIAAAQKPVAQKSQTSEFDNMHNIGSYVVQNAQNIPMRYVSSSFYVLEIPYIFTDIIYFFCYEPPTGTEKKGKWVCFAQYHKRSKTWEYDSRYVAKLKFTKS